MSAISVSVRMVEVLGRYSNHADQQKRLRHLLQIEPEPPERSKPRTPKRVCKKLSPEDIRQLVEAYRSGQLVEQIANDLAIDQWTVQKHARRAALPRRSPRLGPRQLEEARDLYESGRSLKWLGTHFNVSPETVRAAFIRNGIRLRKRRGW